MLVEVTAIEGTVSAMDTETAALNNEVSAMGNLVSGLTLNLPGASLCNEIKAVNIIV